MADSLIVMFIDGQRYAGFGSVEQAKDFCRKRNVSAKINVYTPPVEEHECREPVLQPRPGVEVAAYLPGIFV